MYMYLVQECVDTHNRKYETIAIFFRKKDALKFAKDNMWMYESWYSNKPLAGLKVVKTER